MECSDLELVAVCDRNEKISIEISEKYNVPYFNSVDEMLLKVVPDIAIVAVPHDAYLPIIKSLAKKHIYIIKEKPFATNMMEALEIHKVVKHYNVFLGITLQSRFDPIFQSFLEFKKRIGKIFSIEGRYTLNIENLEQGWRSSKLHAGGGALIDMGYHYVDLLIWYMGLPQTITAKLSRGNRVGQTYDVEDTALLMFDYNVPSEDEKILGNLIISRVYPKKEEKLIVYGTDGRIELQKEGIRRFDKHGEEVECLLCKDKKQDILAKQLSFFVQKIKCGDAFSDLYQEHFKHIALIEAAYKSNRTNTSIKPQEILEQYEIGGEND